MKLAAVKQPTKLHPLSSSSSSCSSPPTSPTSSTSSSSSRSSSPLYSSNIIIRNIFLSSTGPQTIEAMKHAQYSKVSMIVAANKINPIYGTSKMTWRYGVEIEDLGGDTKVVCVSGKTVQGMGATLVASLPTSRHRSILIAASVAVAVAPKSPLSMTAFP